MSKRAGIGFAAMVAVTLANVGGCIEVILPSIGGESQPTFVVSGQAKSIEENGSCFVWEADDGQTFVLVQDSSVANADFDAATTPGTRSRLELTTRTDLGRSCRSGASVAEVDKILEIDGNDVGDGSGDPGVPGDPPLPG